MMMDEFWSNMIENAEDKAKLSIFALLVKAALDGWKDNGNAEVAIIVVNKAYSDLIDKIQNENTRAMCGIKEVE